MAISRYANKSTVFEPQSLTAMSEALEVTTAALRIESETKRRVVAKFIIRLAKENPRLDASALSERAIAALGSQGYVAQSVPALAE